MHHKSNRVAYITRTKDDNSIPVAGALRITFPKLANPSHDKKKSDEFNLFVAFVLHNVLSQTTSGHRQRPLAGVNVPAMAIRPRAPPPGSSGPSTQRNRQPIWAYTGRRNESRSRRGPDALPQDGINTAEGRRTQPRRCERTPCRFT